MSAYDDELEFQEILHFIRWMFSVGEPEEHKYKWVNTE